MADPILYLRGVELSFELWMDARPSVKMIKEFNVPSILHAIIAKKKFLKIPTEIIVLIFKFLKRNSNIKDRMYFKTVL